MKDLKNKLTYCYADDGEQIMFCNNKQVMLGVLVRLKGNDCELCNFNIVKPVVLYTSIFNGTVKEITSGQRYMYCYIDKNNKKTSIIKNKKRSVKINNDLVVVPYQSLFEEEIERYVREFMEANNIKENDVTKQQIISLYLSNIIKQIISNNEKEKKRVRH